MANFNLSEAWKNFQLGTELSISGNFIYNGFYCLDIMEHFCYNDEIFEVLYNFSVGIERLQKILIILTEHNDFTDQESFEKELITHNHIILHNRISKICEINFGKQNIELLSILSSFYKSTRYQNYSIKSVRQSLENSSEFIKFLEKNLKIEISTEFFKCSPNSDKIKKFVGKIVGKISKEYFSQINSACHKLNIYTNEFPSNSKAIKIFWGEKYDFLEDRLVQKEVLKYLIQAKLPEIFNNFIQDVPALDLNFFHTNYYIDYILDIHKKGGIKEELDEIYCDIRNIKERLDHLAIIGNKDYNLDDDYSSD